MSAAERADLDVDGDLAVGFCRELTLRIEETKATLAAWHAARDAAAVARDAVEPAKKRAWAAQLRDAADADELTRRFEEARHEADRARRELTAATERVRDAVGNAESDVARMRTVTLSGEAAARVERMALVTIERARIARDEAGLGPSPEDEAARRSADAHAGATVPTEPPETGRADGGSTADAARENRAEPKEPRIVIVGGVEIVVGVDSMVLVLQAGKIGCRSQTLIDALNNKGEIEGAALYGEGKNPPWSAPRRALVAWGRARRQLPVAP